MLKKYRKLPQGCLYKERHYPFLNGQKGMEKATGGIEMLFWLKAPVKLCSSRLKAFAFNLPAIPPDPLVSLFQERAVFLIRQLAEKDLPDAITGFVYVAFL
jgi:hypothetical protein